MSLDRQSRSGRGSGRCKKGKRSVGVKQELSSTIRKMRKGAGFRNMAALAESIGLSRQSVHKYESGQSVPTNRVLNKLVGAFGIDPSSAEAVRLRSLAEAARSESGAMPAKLLFGEKKEGDLTERANSLLMLFREYCGELDPSVEFTLERKIKKILEG